MTIADLRWAACVGRFQPPAESSSPGGDRQELPHLMLDRQAEYLGNQAFAWWVSARPVPPPDVDAQLADLRRQLFRLRQIGRTSESESLRAEWAAAWYGELARAGPGGAWEIEIAAAAATLDEARAVGACLCAAAQLAMPTYRIAPLDDPSNLPAVSSPAAGGRATGIGDRDSAEESPLPALVSPFMTTAAAAATLIRPPLGELPGVRAVSEPTFDVAVDDGPHETEEMSAAAGTLEIGSVLDRFGAAAGACRLPQESLQRHTFVCGATGGGKSQTVRTLLEGLSRLPCPVPWLVIEPAKAEYARMAGRLKGATMDRVLVIRPGETGAAPAGLNPLEPASLQPGDPARTFPLQGHADLVRALFLAAFRADEPFPQVLSRALEDCYRRAGWDLVTGLGRPAQLAALHARVRPAAGAWLPRLPTLGDLQSSARQVVDDIGYDEDIKKRVRGFVDVRVGSLRTGAAGRFFEGGHPLDVAALLDTNAVIEIESLTNDSDKAFVMGVVLIRIFEHLLLEERERFDRSGGDAPLRHVLVIEEAHRLLRRTDDDSPAAHALELFASMLAEVRAYGEGLVIAEQVPSKILADVIKNTAVKVMHRLPAQDDRDAVGATMNLTDEQSRYVVSLKPGQAAVFADGMDRPLLVQITKGWQAESAKGASSQVPLVPGRRRATACGAPCRTGSPCQLSTIADADAVLREHPLLIFWAEAACVAHVVGVPAPELRPSSGTRYLAALARREPRLALCALASAIEHSVGARYARLADSYDPDGLAVHLADVGAAVLRGEGVDGCEKDAGRWRAGQLRFTDLFDESGDRPDGGSAREANPLLLAALLERGADFTAADGRPPSRAELLVSLPRVTDSDHRALLRGDDSERSYAAAAARLATAPRPEFQLIEVVLTHFRWPSVRQQEATLQALTSALPAHSS
jgi:DNA helicase HerA-like ATPase